MDDDQSMKDQRILLIGDPKEKVKAMAVQVCCLEFVRYQYTRT